MRRSLCLYCVLSMLSTAVHAGLFTDSQLVARVHTLEEQQKVLIQQGEAMRLALDHERLKDLKEVEDKKHVEEACSDRWVQWQHEYGQDKRNSDTQLSLVTKRLDRLDAAVATLNRSYDVLSQRIQAQTMLLDRMKTQTLDRLFYQSALSAIQKGHAQQAEMFLSMLLDAYPIDRLPSDILYWHGMSALMTRHYHDSVTALSTFVKKMPQSDKVPLALLSLYEGYTALGKVTDANVHRYRLLHDYPHSEAAVALKKKVTAEHHAGNNPHTHIHHILKKSHAATTEPAPVDQIVRSS